MTITFATSPRVLGGSSSPVVFTATGELAFINVSFVEQDGAASRVWPEEPAFRDGGFIGRYKASTKVGTTYYLRRDGAWPLSPLPHVEEKGGLVPALQPSTGDSILSHWPLTVVGSAVSGVDVVGGRDLNGGSIAGQDTTVPDIIPGRARWNVRGRAGFSLPTVDDLKSVGALSLVARLSLPVVSSVSDYQYLFTVANFASNPAGAGNSLFTLALGTGGDARKLIYYAQHGSSSIGSLCMMSVAVPNDALDHVVSCCRSSDGTVVTLGVDGVYEAFTGLVAPDGGANAVLFLGGDSASAEAESYRGTFTDCAVFAANLAQARCNYRAGIMLGRAVA